MKNMNKNKRKLAVAEYDDADVYDFTDQSERGDNGTFENIEIIEDLCNILKRIDSPALEWLNKVEESLKDIDYFTELEFTDEKKTQSLNYPLLPQVFHLLRECLLLHHWPEALKVFNELPTISVGASRTIWKVGTELLAMDGESNSDLMQDLFNKMKIVKELNCKEVVLDYVVYLLSINDSNDAIEMMQVKIKKPSETNNEYLNSLHKAYMGLLWYLEWKKACDSLEKEKTRHEESLMGSQPPSTSRVMSYAAQKKNFYCKAIACFEEIKDIPGIWDMFIQRHVELLMHEEMTEDALKVLTNYVDNNPENLHAHKYLYKFCQTNYPEKDLLGQLQTVAKMCPSDELVLDLCSKLMKDDVYSALKQLFKLLDYSCWQDKMKPWKMMADCLHTYKVNG
ncbi:TATA box-binding protein-associated factor RNA polymerase I subunit A [Mactra antiquata]